MSTSEVVDEEGAHCGGCVGFTTHSPLAQVWSPSIVFVRLLEEEGRKAFDDQLQGVP